MKRPLTLLGLCTVLGMSSQACTKKQAAPAPAPIVPGASGAAAGETIQVPEAPYQAEKRLAEAEKDDDEATEGAATEGSKDLVACTDDLQGVVGQKKGEHGLVRCDNKEWKPLGHKPGPGHAPGAGAGHRPPHGPHHGKPSLGWPVASKYVCMKVGPHGTFECTLSQDVQVLIKKSHH